MDALFSPKLGQTCPGVTNSVESSETHIDLSYLNCSSVSFHQFSQTITSQGEVATFQAVEQYTMARTSLTFDSDFLRKEEKEPVMPQLDPKPCSSRSALQILPEPSPVPTSVTTPTLVTAPSDPSPCPLPAWIIKFKQQLGNFIPWHVFLALDTLLTLEFPDSEPIDLTDIMPSKDDSQAELLSYLGLKPSREPILPADLDTKGLFPTRLLDMIKTEYELFPVFNDFFVEELEDSEEQNGQENGKKATEQSVNGNKRRAPQEPRGVKKLPAKKARTTQ